MTYKTFGLFVGGLILMTADPALAQNWGHPRTPSSGACFYEDINYGGRYFCSPVGSTTARVPSGTNNQISSIRIFGNVEVLVFRDNNFKGQSARFAGNVNDLRRSGWNDRISSFRIQGRGFGNGGNQGGSRWTYQQAEQIVRRGYLSVLEREPDPAARSWVTEVMKNNWSQRQLDDQLRNTQEYRDKHRR